jgi:hypothetical protein
MKKLNYIVLGVAGLSIVAWANQKGSSKEKTEPGTKPEPGSSCGEIWTCTCAPKGYVTLSRDELQKRIRAKIKLVRPFDRWAYNDSIASAITYAKESNLPVDLIAAMVWQESKFQRYLEPLDRKITYNEPIGPLQVRAVAFKDVGMNPLLMIGISEHQQIHMAVQAGMKYLNKIRQDYLPKGNWCDWLHAYNVGIGDFRAGKRNYTYVNSIMEKATQYSDLRG